MEKEFLHYTIDFTNVETYWDMHFIIRDALDFPDYYGCNWSAFWDCISDMYGDIIHIEIIGLDVVERKFGDAAYKMMEILKRFKTKYPEYSDDITIEIVHGSTRIKVE